MSSKVIIVTGASRGIGLAVAQYLIKASHKVVLVARSEPELKTLKEQAPSAVEYITADLSETNEASRITQFALKSFGRIDGVVINHGTLSPIKKIADLNVDEWRKVYDINFFSAAALAKETIPALQSTQGRVVFVSSGAAVGAYTAWGPYGSSKAALNSLSAHLNAEEPDIVSVAIAPGRVDTAMQKDLRDNGKASMASGDHANFVEAHEKGELLRPEQPGNVIARLAIDATKEIGGKYLRWDATELAKFQDEAT